jgi:SM-20-related protein
MNPILKDNAFPADLYARLRDTVRAAPMRYGSKSNRNTDPHGHWAWKPIHDSTHNLADLTGRLIGDLVDGWQYVRSHLLPAGTTYKLTRCYSNGYTYGTDGYFHTDSGRPGDITVIIYICDEWPIDWAGETAYTKGEEYWSCPPRPNRALIIPSDMQHAARAVSRKCTALRTTLMFKCRPTRTDVFEKQSTWLVDNGALDLKHSAGSLHDHLMRCHQALGEKKVPDVLCAAAGLHSVYGTNAFTKQLLEPIETNRAKVAGKFGMQAEELAYLFHMIDRPRTLEKKFGGDGCSLEYRFQKSGQHNSMVVLALQLIECANLDDQGSLGKWPVLAELWGSMKTGAA